MSSIPVSGVPSSSSWPLPQANSPRESPSENSNNTRGSAAGNVSRRKIAVARKAIRCCVTKIDYTTGGIKLRRGCRFTHDKAVTRSRPLFHTLSSHRDAEDAPFEFDTVLYGKSEKKDDLHLSERKIGERVYNQIEVPTSCRNPFIPSPLSRNRSHRVRNARPCYVPRQSV